MNRVDYWRQRVLSLLHDPPNKPFATWFRNRVEGKKVASGHFGQTLAILEALKWDGQGEPGSRSKSPDHAAAGADRPNLGFGKQCKVVRWHAEGLVSHPLSPGPLIVTNGPMVSPEDVPAESPERFWRPGETFDAVEIAADEIAQVLGSRVWEDWEGLRRVHIYLWRRFRELLTSPVADAGLEDWSRSLIWSRMPADTRAPDHSIWDHTRMTAALSFLHRKNKEDLPKERTPWMLSFEVGPVQTVLNEARSARDLWTSSYLISDLAWHSMVPVIEEVGMDSVVYPDLRGNPRADRWLKDHREIVVPLWGQDYDPTSRAAVIPDHWMAIVPEGPIEGIPAVSELAKKCQAGFEHRWGELTQRVWKAIEALRAWQSELPAIEKTWKRQLGQVLHTTWAAVPWKSFPDMDQVVPGGALPAQVERAPLPPGLRARSDHLRPWVDDAAWAAYEFAREIQAKHCPGLMRMERGFDYPLVHHQMRLWHRQRNEARPWPAGGAYGVGERCTICTSREALGSSGGHLDQQRQRLIEFWRTLGREVGEPRFGEERLCAVCLFKRLLIKTGRPEEDSDFNRGWAGQPSLAKNLRLESGLPAPHLWMKNPLRMPFPSTAAVAAQAFLREVCTDARLQRERDEVVAAARASGRDRTQWPASLPSLAGIDEELLKYDAQIVHPESVRADFARENRVSQGKGASSASPSGRQSDKQTALLTAIKALRKKAIDLKLAAPDTRFALLKLDGDSMGKLLLGDPSRTRNLWRSVLHPEAAAKVENGPWAALLDHPRQMGPSLHGLVSRILADFAHRVVPWVVEREFGGRLIYVGGDDVLAMAPADDAIGIAARLQQVFSAPWIVDTMPNAAAGDWALSRGGPEPWNPERARQRFLIPWPDELGRVGLPVARVASHVWAGESSGSPAQRPVAESVGEYLPMLGPFQSLSAGIVFAHFKTPLRQVIKRAQSLLDDVAKDRVGRSAMGLAIWTRGGVKAEAGIPWYDRSPGEESARSSDMDSGPSVSLRPPENAQRIRRVVKAFGNGSLPGRLPYKLERERRYFSAVELSDREWGAVISALVAKCLDSGESDVRSEDFGDLLEDLTVLYRADRSALLFCRALAAKGEEE